MWIDYSPDLADWVLARLKVRSDAHGAYVRNADGTGTPRVVQADLTRERLIDHFRASHPGALVGVHLASPADTARYTVVDIDAHGPGVDVAKNLAYALHAHDKARAAGLDCRLHESDGTGGYHIYVVHRREVPVRDAWGLGKWLAADAPAFGVTRVESFPKSQSVLHSPKRLGGFVRLPGRHHKRPYWTRVWCPEGGCWLAGENAILSILSLVGSARLPDEVLPAEFLPEIRVATSRREPGRTSLSLLRDVARARSALEALGEDYFEPYDLWLKIGMSLRGLGAEGLRLWHEWSSRASNYDAQALDGRWDDFKVGDAGTHQVGLATLFYHAREEGWVDLDRHEFEAEGGARVTWAREAITIGLRLRIASQEGEK